MYAFGVHVFGLLASVDGVGLLCLALLSLVRRVGEVWNPLASLNKAESAPEFSHSARRIWLPTAIALYIVYFFCDGRRGVRKEKRPFPSWSTFATIVSRIPVSSFDEDCRQSTQHQCW